MSYASTFPAVYPVRLPYMMTLSDGRAYTVDEVSALARYVTGKDCECANREGGNFCERCSFACEVPCTRRDDHGDAVEVGDAPEVTSRGLVHALVLVSCDLPAHLAPKPGGWTAAVGEDLQAVKLAHDVPNDEARKMYKKASTGADIFADARVVWGFKCGFAECDARLYVVERFSAPGTLVAFETKVPHSHRVARCQLHEVSECRECYPLQSVGDAGLRYPLLPAILAAETHPRAGSPYASHILGKARQALAADGCNEHSPTTLLAWQHRNLAGFDRIVAGSYTAYVDASPAALAEHQIRSDLVKPRVRGASGGDLGNVMGAALRLMQDHKGSLRVICRADPDGLSVIVCTKTGCQLWSDMCNAGAGGAYEWLRRVYPAMDGTGKVASNIDGKKVFLNTLTIPAPSRSEPGAAPPHPLLVLAVFTTGRTQWPFEKAVQEFNGCIEEFVPGHVTPNPKAIQGDYDLVYLNPMARQYGGFADYKDFLDAAWRVGDEAVTIFADSVKESVGARKQLAEEKAAAEKYARDSLIEQGLARAPSDRRTGRPKRLVEEEHADRAEEVGDEAGLDSPPPRSDQDIINPDDVFTPTADELSVAREAAHAHIRAELPCFLLACLGHRQKDVKTWFTFNPQMRLLPPPRRVQMLRLLQVQTKLMDNTPRFVGVENGPYLKRFIRLVHEFWLMDPEPLAVPSWHLGGHLRVRVPDRDLDAQLFVDGPEKPATSETCGSRSEVIALAEFKYHGANFRVMFFERHRVDFASGRDGAPGDQPEDTMCDEPTQNSRNGEDDDDEDEDDDDDDDDDDVDVDAVMEEVEAQAKLMEAVLEADTRAADADADADAVPVPADETSMRVQCRWSYPGTANGYPVARIWLLRGARGGPTASPWLKLAYTSLAVAGNTSTTAELSYRQIKHSWWTKVSLPKPLPELLPVFVNRMMDADVSFIAQSQSAGLKTARTNVPLTTVEVSFFLMTVLFCLSFYFYCLSFYFYFRYTGN